MLFRSYTKKVRVFSPVAECMSEDSLFIQVEPPFAFDWVHPVDTTISYGQSVKMNSQSDAIAWYWYPVTYLSSATIKDPVSTPHKTIEYSLVGMNIYGCTDTTTLKINVIHGTNIKLPNAFTPNGDGHNDIFKLANVEFETLQEFKVFNRYGQVVFETSDINQGWDGTFKGQPAPMDTYMYLIRVTLSGGDSHSFKGDVTLMR